MKTNQLFSKARWLLTSCLMLLIFSTNAWGAMELVNINFKSWTPQNISAGSTVNGCYFKSATTISAANGATFSGNATTSVNYVAIPLSGINGSITITLTHASSKPQWKNYFKGLNAVPSSSDLSGAPSSMGDNTRPGSNTTTSSWTINTDKLYGVFYVGKGSNGLTDIYSITITTPDWTYYYRGADNSWGGTAMTNSSAGFYSYKSSTTNNHQFKIAKSADGWDYNYSFVDAGYLGTSITTIGDYGSDNCYIWSAPASYNIIVFRPGSPMNTTASPKICASATLPAEKFTISFNNGGGSGSMSSISNVLYASDKATTANTFTKDGYRFTGWHANVDVKVGGATKTAGTLLDDEVTIQEIKSDITLTAQWEVDDGCNKIFWFANSADAETNGVKNNTTTFSGVTAGTSAVTGSITIDGKTYTATGRGTNNNTTITFTVPASKVGTLYGLANSSGSSARTLTLTNTASYSETQSTSASSSTAGAFTFEDMPAGSYSLAWSGNGAENMLCLKLCDAGVVCTATAPGALSKGTLSGCSRTITASGSAATNNTWYWQSSSTGTDKSDAYSSGKAITETGTYYLRSYCTDGTGCWSDAVSVEITTADMTPAAPTNFTAGSISATGATFTITDAGNASSYDIYYSTSSTAPTSDVTTTSTSKSKAVTGLTFNTTYYAWVRAVCGSNKSDWVALSGSTFTTSNTAPTSASISPSNGWIYVPGEEITLTASAETTNASTTYTWYRGATLEAAKAAGAIQVAKTAAAGGTAYTIAECVAADAYKYWVEISNGTGYETSTSYDIKIYTFFLYDNTPSKIDDYTFSTIDRVNNKISVTIPLSNINYTYQFKVSDGLGTWYGCNDATITGSHAYWDGLNSSGANVGLTSSFADDYKIDYYYNSNNVVVTYPVHNQAEDVTVYFDNRLTEMENMYIRIGHDANNKASSAFTLVPGTANLYVGTTTSFNDFHAWSIADNTGWTSSNTIYQPWYNSSAGKNEPDGDYAITKQTNYQRYVVDETISIIPTSENNTEYGCTYWNVDKVSGMKKDNVSITAPTNGTITVAYTSGSGGSITSGNVDLAHTSILTVSAVGNTGYDLSTLTINESAHTSGETYVLSEDAVVAATFTGHTYTVSLDKEGGSGTASVSAQYQASLSTSALFDAPTFSGYTYAGFYTDHAGAGSQLIDENRKWVKSVDTYTDGTPKWIKTSNVTLYAKWTQSVTVDDNDENHGSTTGSISMVYKGTGPSSFTAATGVAGYTLRGYYSAATGGTKILNADGSFAGTNVSVNTTPYISGGKWVHEGATTLYPQYDILTYTVSTTVGTSGAATGGASITNGSVSSVPYGTTVTNNGDNTFTVNTASPTTVTATASVAGVAGPDDDDACTYVFTGWENLPSTVTADVNNIHALYEARFTIGFKETDGTAVAGISSTYYVYGTGKAVSTFPAPTKSGYTFAGWYKDDALTSPATDLDNEAYGAIDYYAKWNISYDFQMIANSSAASDATLDLDEYLAQGSKNCVTLTGGTAQYQGASGKTMKVNASNGSGTSQYYGWYFNSSGDKIVVTLSSHVLQVGSVISVEGYGANGNGITANTSTSLMNGTGAQQQWSASHTVVAGDTHLVGKNVITFDRYNSCRIFSIRISNCASATPCTTPTLPSLSNQEGCSYSEWNATPTNASTISAAGESISYSWKKGATEKATTASYTPDADGTDYTVTVTVSKAGKISTSVTSSALTATKYGNPSVTGPSDAEYEVGDNATNLSVTATPTHGETLTYQWYSNTAKSTSSPTPTALANCTTSTYKPSTAATGTTYYFCKVSGGCADVNSSIATVTVNEASCLRATITKNSGDYTLSTGNGETKDITSDATVTSGGAVKLVNNFNGSKKFSFSDNGVAPGTTDGYVEVVLPSGSVLDAGSVIRITGAGTEDGAGLLLIDDAGTTIASQINNGAIDFSYTVTAVSTLKYKNHIRIARAKASNTNYFKSVTITGCVECTPITPTLNYSKTTFWMDDATLTATPTLTGYYGSPTISYASSDPTVVRVDNSSTGAITALKRGTATITATIGATTVSTTDYCGNTATCDIKVKDMSCGYTEIASAVLTSKTSATCTNATLLNANMSNSSAPYKLDKTLPSYFGLQLSSGNFQVGDSIIFKVKIGDMDINGGSTYPVAFYHTTDTSSYTTSNLIYTSGAQTKNTDNVYIRFIVTQAMIDAGLTNKILIIRSGRVKQNHSMYEARIKRYGCPDIFIYDDAADTHEWSDEDNWIGATGHGSGIPTIEDRAIITKPITVDIAHAAAAAVILDQSSTNTGKLTIEANKGLEVAGTVTRTTTGSNSLATREEDLVLESSSAGNASLIFDNSNGCEATVQMYSKASIDEDWNWQYVGTPFTGSIPSYNYYGSWMYKWNGGWEVVHGNDELTPFAGYCLTQESATTHVMGGTLVPTTSKSVTMAASTDMVLANSWTAAISIAAFDIEGGDATFTSTPATIYLFNTGSAEDGSEAGSEAGTYIAVPINSAPYTGNGLIAPMQGFFVTTNGGNAGTITMNYDALVRPSGSHTDIVAGPMKAPRRAQEADNKPAVLKMWANGSEYNDRVVILEREDFSEGFDNGWDGEKMSFGNASPSVYVINAQGGYDAVSAIPTLEGTVVGFRAGADSQYTMTFSYEGEDEWYLNDLQTETSTLISGEQTYSFAAEKEDSEVRFVISKTPIQKVPTGVEDAVSGQQSAVRKVLINDHIYIIRGGRIYSADGQLVK